MWGEGRGEEGGGAEGERGQGERGMRESDVFCLIFTNCES
jgi:hypothetical protein